MGAEPEDASQTAKELRSALGIVHNIAICVREQDICVRRRGKKTMGEAVRQMFTAIAQHYDVLNTVLSFGLHHYWRQQAVAVSSLPSGACLLDVCSGTADLALAFARYLGPNGQVIATDFCAAMMSRGH